MSRSGVPAEAIERPLGLAAAPLTGLQAAGELPTPALLADFDRFLGMQTVRQAASFTEGLFDVNYARLSRFVERGGAEFRRPLEALRRMPFEEGLAYAWTLNRLYDAGGRMRYVYPDAVGAEVAAAAQALSANSLFAIEHHINFNYETRALLQWRPTEFVDIELYGRQPLCILKDMVAGYEKTDSAFNDPDSRTVPVTYGEGFRHYRFINLRTMAPSSMLMYIRPFGTDHINKDYEFSRTASVGIRVRTSDDFLPVQRALEPDDVFAWRLDRDPVVEPFRDKPDDRQTQEGMLVMDVGAMREKPGRQKNDPHSKSTLIGRFVALGNMKRGADYRLEVDHNHFSIPGRYGDQSYFALMALQMQERAEGMRATRDELMDYARGASARWAAKCALAARNT
jgi:hypothetical protein